MDYEKSLYTVQIRPTGQTAPLLTLLPHRGRSEHKNSRSIIGQQHAQQTATAYIRIDRDGTQKIFPKATLWNMERYARAVK